MSTINKYELLKREGTWEDRLKYVLSLSDQTEIEKHLKQSSSYDDLQMLILLSKSRKNEKNLLEIFKTDSLPIRRRICAGKSWLKIQRDEKQIQDFIVETINGKTIPQFFKNKIIQDLHKIVCVNKSSSFFYNLVCRLTETYRHDQYDINAYLVPFCSKDEILNLLSQWSIERFEQIDSSSLFSSKLLYYHPLLGIHLIQCDLNEKKKNNEKLSNYFQKIDGFLSLLANKEAKAVFRIIIEYMNQLEKHERLLPYFIQSKQKYFFKKIPDEMIELITLVAANQPGTIKYQTPWNASEGTDLDAFIFPRSFFLDHYLRLFFALYDTCKWSSNHTIRLLQYMLKYNNTHLGLYSSRKQRKWLIDIVVHERIGKELFIEKLINEGDETTLKLFEEYAEITTPLSLHLISQIDTNKTIPAKQLLSLIRYQSMTKDIFDQFLTLFYQTNSNVKQREQNYVLFLQCAFSTNNEQVKNVLEWTQKRFIDERGYIIQTFLCSFSQYNNRFHLEILPKNLETIEAIVELALNYVVPSSNTLQMIVDYGLLLLQRVEYHPNKETREQIQIFACKIIKRCFSMHDGFKLYTNSLSESYPIARNLIADILISDVFSKYLSRCMLDELNNSIDSYLQKSWRIPQIDAFINSFFTDHLPSSTKLQSVFQIDTHSSMISSFLKKHSSQLERVNQLINKIDKVFFINEAVQRIAVSSQQYRQLIDKLIEDNKCVTSEKLSNEESKLATNLQSQTKNMKFPGLNINILNSSFRYLTGKQQEHITKIILHDFIKDNEVTYPKKLKSLRALHHLTHTYNESLQWFDEKQTSLSLKSNIVPDVDPFDNIIICLPVTFDLTPQELLKQFHFLKMKLNASNAKFISDAMLTISRRLPEEIFLKHYLDLVRDEQFQKLGITANKEILRLLNEYASDSSLITSLIKPLWDSRPHQDVRACLILTLLNFLTKRQSNDAQIIIWKILEEAAYDNYLPVVQSVFSAHRGSSRWPVTRLINSRDETFQTFINRIQFKILDHPTSLEARLWAWSNIDFEHCDLRKLIEKVKQLCLQFNKDANTLWENAFNKIISFYKQKNISLDDPIVDIIKKLMSRREEVDFKQNAINDQHDLPVYHRIHRILTNLINHIQQFDNEKKLSFRSFAPIILQFDKTFAVLIGTLLIKIAQNRDDLESMLILLQDNLSANYFESVLIQLATVLSKNYSCSFIERLNVNEQFDLAQWFIKEKDQGLFVFDLFKNHIINRSYIDLEQRQNLLRQMRQSENLFLRQKALGYTVQWKRKKEKPQRQCTQKRAPNDSSDPDISDINLFDVFDDVQS